MNKTSLLNMDCMEYMANCKDDFFALAVCDPPYGIGEDGAKNHSRNNKAEATKYTSKKWDLKPPSADYFSELFRVSKNQIIWGANYMSEFLPPSMGWVFWDKQASGDFSDGELAFTSFNRALRKFTFAWMGMRQGNMKNKEKRIHPTQKPVALYKWLLNNYAEKGQKIIDTHLGSGSSAIAAHYFGCDFTGIEIDKDYFEAAQERFRESTRQLAMW